MYTRNQLIITGLVVAAASALITSYIMKEKAKNTTTTTEEKTSGFLGKKKLIITTKTKTGQNLKWVVSDHNPNNPDAYCNGFWVSQYGSDHWQCIQQAPTTTT